MECIFESLYEDDPREAFAATVGVQPPPERLGRSLSRNNYFYPDGADGGATRATAPRGPLPPWLDYLAANGSLDNTAPRMRPSTQNALDRLRRGIEAARIEEARLDSLLSAISAQALPQAPPLPGPSPVYANVPISQSSAPALYANAALFNPLTARPPKQSAFGWQPSAPQRDTPSVWQPPPFLPQQLISSYDVAQHPTSAPYLSAPPPPPRIQATAYQQSGRSAPFYDVPIRSAPFPVLPPVLPPQTASPPAPPPSAPAPPPPFSGVPGGENAAGSGRGITVSGPPGGPGDPDEDPDKQKRDKEIDDKCKRQFLFDSAALKAAKNRSRGSMKCEVPSFERGTKLTIQDRINQMKTYFTIGQIPPESFVGFMMTKIVPRHLNEIKQYRSLNYLPFREKLIEVFEKPDIATAYLNALASLSPTRDETISEYMHRARLLVLKAYPDLAHASL